MNEYIIVIGYVLVMFTLLFLSLLLCDIIVDKIGNKIMKFLKW